MYKHLTKNKYQLHAVCIHDGSAESGHYYTLIKDHQKNTWREFNDIRVREVEEQSVLSQSKGGEGYRSAYWVVYISQRMLNEYSRLSFGSFDTVDMTKNVSNHAYNGHLDAGLLGD